MKWFGKKKTKQIKKTNPYKADVDPHAREIALQKNHKKRKVISTPHLGILATLKLIFSSHQANMKKIRANRDPLDIKLEQRLQKYSYALKFPANLLNHNEKRAYCIMGVRPQTVRSYTTLRLVASIAMEILPILGAVFFPKYAFYCMLSLFLVPFLTWFLIGLTIKSTLKMYAIKQQDRLVYLMSVMSPYLYQMNGQTNEMSTETTHVSINYILGSVMDRLHDVTLQNMVAQWNIGIRRHPASFLPYEAFAQKFLGSGLANSFVYAVYQLANGATDTTSIHYLNRTAREDYLREIKRITDKKVARFNRLPIVYIFDWVFLIFCYLLVLVKDTMVHALSQSGL